MQQKFWGVARGLEFHRALDATVELVVVKFPDSFLELFELWRIFTQCEVNSDHTWHSTYINGVSQVC
jgi:hypothetical protein